MNTETMRQTLELVADERHRQYLKWGVQDPPGVLPELTGPKDAAEFYEIPEAWLAKCRTNQSIANDDYTWADILIEEVSEAVEAATLHHLGLDTREALIKELVQVAAVAVQWIEMLED
ncbi:hypothetical protein [Mycobacterium sp. CnD-18-1]|uniref:hypothetical protein n=1 Tax=Mycobacterium sp. CnD-18-1 TaxID=2917744 RepID=UPI001EF3D162|nr:hypothetical protein [Mycobacterium sp. CnD-18-1]MCG7607150.1 hypothetical protein [Mycobacterium sp. CnD-18-1]